MVLTGTNSLLFVFIQWRWRYVSLILDFDTKYTITLILMNVQVRTTTDLNFSRSWKILTWLIVNWIQTFFYKLLSLWNTFFDLHFTIKITDICPISLVLADIENVLVFSLRFVARSSILHKGRLQFQKVPTVFFKGWVFWKIFSHLFSTSRYFWLVLSCLG